MSKKTPNSFFISSSRLRLYSPRLYQWIFLGVTNYEGLANRIIKLIQPAQAFRDLEGVREMATILRNVPIERYRLAGDYYLLWCKCREGEYNTEAVENIIDRANGYKPKGLLLRAAMEGYQSNIDAEIYFYKEALKTSPTVSEYIAISNAIAVVKAKQGSHQSAIRDLERLVPLIRYADPLVCLDLLNSYAVELGEVGRKDEARNIIQVVLASPLALAYPEWQQTAVDLQTPSRSMVQVGGASNVLSMTSSSERVVESPPIQPAKVFSLAEWKEKMVKEQNNEPDENVDELEKSDLIVRLLELTTKDDMNEEKLRKILKYSYKVMTGK